MDERRRSSRLKDENEIIITVISNRKKLSKETISYNYSKDISVSGAKIQTNILLPIDTLLKIDFKLKTLAQQITALGKVEPRRQESAAPKSTFGSKSRRILMRHPVAEGAFIPRQNRGPSA